MSREFERFTGVSEETFVASKVANLEAFFTTRGLEHDCVERAVGRRVGSYRHLLVTSSPVHGLANALSDIDTICITEEEQAGERMAAQVFDGREHYEYVTFSTREVDEALAALVELSTGTPTAAIAALRRWDDRNHVRRKYLERIVNGVGTDGTMPYLSWLPALGRVWKWSSVDSSVRSGVFLVLAETAGESRGRIGYALNAMLYLLDAILSQHGDVYSNKKWYMLRWQRFLAGGAPSAALDGLLAAIDGLQTAIEAGLRRAEDADASEAFCRVLDSARSLLGVDAGNRIGFEPVASSAAGIFLPGAVMRHDGRQGLMLRGGPEAELPKDADLRALCDLDAASAGRLLRELRANLLRLTIWPTTGDEVTR